MGIQHISSRWYDAWYFRHSCGKPYERNEEWLKFFGTIADRIVAEIRPRTVLDVGCAMGFLVEALRDRGVEAFGIDISEFAISQARDDIKAYIYVASILDPLPNALPSQYDLIVCIEVLEHLPSSQVDEAIKRLCQLSNDILFSSTPEDYREITHLNVQPLEYWAERFALHGFFRDVDFDASFITPWAVRWRRITDPFHRVIRNYERKFWRLWRENVELRIRLLELRDELAQKEALNEDIVKTARINTINSGFFAVNMGTIKNFIGSVRLTLANPIRMIYLIRFAWDILRREGVWVLPHLVCGFLKKQKHQFNQDYLKWIALYDTLTDEDRNKIREHIKLLSYKPLISIIMPVWNTPEAYLRRAIESVLNQLYPYWELCIADDASEYPHIRRVLNEYQLKDKRIKVVFREKRGHIAQASNSALAIATGEFIALLDHDDILPEHALYMVAVELNRYPEADIIYTDEDRIDERGVRSDPYFKPDWNYDLFLGQNCISHLGVYRTALVREVGGFQEGYEGAQDWDLAMRIIERIPPSHIRHIPFILYHWRAIPGSAALNITEKPYVKDAQYKTLASHFERIGQKAEILSVRGIFWRIRYPVPQPPPLVTLIVTVWSREDFLIRCLNSLLKKTKFPFYQIIVIKNSKNSPKMEQYIEQIARNYPVQTIDCATSFNYAAMNNLAASQARGEILGFLHDDIEIINSNWLEEMVSHAIRPGVGAVGAMLYYPDMRIQHAGIILGLLGSAGHLYRHFPKDYSGHGGRALLTQSLSAVTGACLILRKDVFDKVGGFDEQLATAFYDVDLCLRIREQGYRIIWTPFAKLIHHAVCERQNNINNEQYKQEIVLLKERWGDILLNDPAYNPNLTLNREDSSLAFPPRIRKPWLENNFQYR